MSTSATTDFEQRLSRVEQLLAEISEDADPRVERMTREVLATVLELHQRGLARMLAASDEPSRRALAADAHISALLLLHDLHPLSLETRATLAVNATRERISAKLEDVTMDVRDGRIAVRVVPSTGACSSTRSSLKAQFEAALLSAAPDASSVSVELTEPAPVLVTLRLPRAVSGAHGTGGPR